MPDIGNSAEDEWLRLPKPGLRLFALSRTSINELISDGHVKAMTLRRPGRIRGLKLIYGPSLREYLHRQLKMQNENGGEM